MKQIYAGPVNPQTGQSLYPGLPLGSEFGWDGLDPAPAGCPRTLRSFNGSLEGSWEWRQFDFDRDYATYTQKLAEMVNATNPDIDTFRAHGHKLLMYHGWSDWLVAPGESINYYNAVVARRLPHRGKPAGRSTRGAAEVGNFRPIGPFVHGPGHGALRAAVPGKRISMHSGAVVDWVEHGVPPERIIASKLPIAETGAAANVRRPLCPYPRVAQYQGSGSTNDASNFVCR